jgi:pentatricopeptide repeat protein
MRRRGTSFGIPRKFMAAVVPMTTKKTAAMHLRYRGLPLGMDLRSFFGTMTSTMTATTLWSDIGGSSSSSSSSTVVASMVPWISKRCQSSSTSLSAARPLLQSTTNTNKNNNRRSRDEQLEEEQEQQQRQQQQVSKAIEKAYRLLDQKSKKGKRRKTKSNVLWSVAEMQSARQIIDFLTKQQQSSSPPIILEHANVLLELYLHAIRQIAQNKEIASVCTLWFCKDLSKFHMILWAWKERTMRGNASNSSGEETDQDDEDSILPPAHVWNTLIEASCRCDAIYPFQRHEMTRLHILEAAMSTAPSVREVPIIAEMVLDTYRKGHPEDSQPKNNNKNTTTKRIESMTLYNVTMLAWARSGLPEAADKIESIYQHAQTHDQLSPNDVTHQIRLRFWGLEGSITKIDSVWKEILQLSSSTASTTTRTSAAAAASPKPPGLLAYRAAIFAYARNGALDKAKDVLEQLVEVPEDAAFLHDDPEVIATWDPLQREKEQTFRWNTIIRDSVRQIMDGYRKALPMKFSSSSSNPRVHNPEDRRQLEQQCEKIVEQARMLLERMRIRYPRISPDSWGATLLDMYARVGKPDQVESLAEELRLGDVQMEIMIRAYARNGEPERAEELLRTLLERPISQSRRKDGSRKRSMSPSIYTFNAVLNAYAMCHRSDAFDRARDILRLLRTHPHCIEQIGGPDTIAYNTLLKCLDQHRPDNVAEIAREIQDEMIQSGNSNCQPDDMTNRIVNRLINSQPVWATKDSFLSSYPSENDKVNDSSFQEDGNNKRMDNDKSTDNEEKDDLDKNIRVTFS